MHNFKELKIWQKAIEFSLEVYRLTAQFPTEEKYSLVSQLRRASVSIPSNIAEGSGRNGDREFIHFLSLSIGSGYEAETQLIIANRLKYISDVELEEAIIKITEIQRMLHSFSETLKAKTCK